MLAPLDHNVRRLFQAVAGEDLLAAVGLLDNRLARFRMLPRFELRDQTVADLFIFSAGLDGALRLPSLQVDPEKRVVRVFFEVSLRPRPVEHGVSHAGFQAAQTSLAETVDGPLQLAGQVGDPPQLDRVENPRHLVGHPAFERQEPRLAEPAVWIHDPVAHAAEAVIGHHQHRGVVGHQTFQLAQLLVQFLIDPQDAVLLSRRVAGELWRIRIAVLPEMMAHAVRLAVENHHAVPRPAGHQVLGRRGFLANRFKDGFDGQIGPALVDLVDRKRADGMTTDVLFQLLDQLRRMDGPRVDRRSLAAETGRVEAADHHAVDRFRRVGARYGDRNHLPAGLAEDLPERSCFALAAVDKLQLVAARPLPGEVEDAVLARILARHEAAPGGERHRRHRRPQRSVSPVLHQRGDVRQFALGHPRANQVKCGTVPANNEYA